MPLYKKLKERIKEGAIGKTKMVQVNFGSNKGYDSTNRFFALEAAGGALLDIGVYATSFAIVPQPKIPHVLIFLLLLALDDLDTICSCYNYLSCYLIK